MDSISVFDIFKIGVGPSSSHTMGPWRAAEAFLRICHERDDFRRIEAICVDLFGSLAKTGVGHGTDVAILLGLAGVDPVECDTAAIGPKTAAIRSAKRLGLRVGGSQREIAFDPSTDLVFHRDLTLPFHPNGLKLTARLDDDRSLSETYYSVGGGFIVQEGETAKSGSVTLPHPIETADELIGHSRTSGLSLPGIVWRNEQAWRTPVEIRAGLERLWKVMRECMYRGCVTTGVLPGSLGVVRRAAGLNRKLLGDRTFDGVESWMGAIRESGGGFRETLKWVSCFALAVNEENASFGRVVTAPTNGAAGVVPAVLMYADLFCGIEDSARIDFFLTAGEIGSLFKKGATLSAAMGGCQAEIGVSSAMAAGGLTQALGGSPGQVLMAAEIAMEHHLGLTCDPVGGLVQIPCIERNTMGAVKAITAANMALDGDPAAAKVSLDAVIRSMWQTALDMSAKYKETSEGGLAIQLPVNLSEC